MSEKIKVKVIEGAIEYNHDFTKVLSETFDGEVLEGVRKGNEYFVKDSEGRKVFVAEIGWESELSIHYGFELLKGVEG
ncbi:hypothetical protein RVS70_05890 [Virgibacillus sp. M23]|uniref:hypothetical protein n=1 Tax=Virgibacillus sp. M23 TaxID=3079030 RepID=UPI002A919BD3|nr:hypothetical protein [Virgibacillus sp. M23]MDY7043733.1 hypothetical protein [Virgibacillus sp. M23]